jgi:N-methylhydantoinase B
LVLRDVRNEFLSTTKARSDYGVVIDTQGWTIDKAATESARAAIRTSRGWTEVPKVQWHDAPSARKAAE